MDFKSLLWETIPRGKNRIKFEPQGRVNIYKATADPLSKKKNIGLCVSSQI